MGKDSGMLIKEVTAAILVHEGRLLIARRGPSARLAGKWEFPGGTIEAGETPDTCLIREMREEFEIGIEVGPYVGDSVYHDDHGSIRLLAYLAFWKRGDLRCRVHDAFVFVRPGDLRDYDFCPADIPFVRGLSEGGIVIV